MCGIGAIVSGIRLSGYPVERETSCKERPQVSKVKSIQYPTIRDIWEALTLRGPDHIGQQTISVGIAEPKNCHNDQRTCKTTAKLRKMTEDLHKCEQCLTTNGVCKLNAELPLDGAVGTSGQAQSGLPHISIEDQNLAAKIQLVGSSLQLRGVHQVSQPLKDSSGSVLVYNGEIFGGLFVGPEENDSEILLSALQKCCTCSCHLCLDSEERCGCIGLTVSSNAHATIPQVLSQLRGPWALIYWQAESQSLWFGRDAFGRRSLLVHWPSDLDPRLVFTSVAPQEIPNLSVTMVPDQSVPHTICSGVNLCDSEKPYRDKVQNENTSGDFIFPLDFASNSSNSICKGKKTEAFSHKETMEGIDRGILKHGQAKDQGCLVDANLRCPDSGIYDYWEELPCGIYSVSMHNPSSLKVEHFYECGIGEPRLPSLSVGLTGTVKKYEWQDELLLKLIQWDRRLVEPNKVNLLTSSRADCNINQTCKFGEANELVGIHDAHILTGTSKARNDASALLGKSLERDSLKSLDPYQTVKNILQNEKEFQLKVSLRDNREAARHFQSKDEQANDAQHSKPGFEHESFSDISIQGEGKTEYYAVQRLQEALKEAVKRRTSNIRRLCQ
ncbi:hypothetical protein O6H91_Y270400 [Diphasiastrum complanatum]|nr:hypothetical protein O6H91_Y270400 [Diphasiastrum complanatum]